MWLPQFWLPASLEFSLEEPRMWLSLASLKVASDRPLNLRLAGTLRVVRLNSLTGVLAWGVEWSHGPDFKGGYLLSRKPLCSDRQLGFLPQGLAPCPGRFRS